jgi:hypothetical protein
VSPETKALQFYWDGVDHEDLYCVCGEPHPQQIFVEALPAKMMRKCRRCGAVAELNEGTGEWLVVSKEAK